MCGLFGIAGPGILMADLYNFRDLGIVSMLRGRYGAGVFQTRTGMKKAKHNDVELWHKVPDSFIDFLDDVDSFKNLKGLLSNCRADVVMGHVRHPTRGMNTTDNAHPYVFRKLVGMHNGTLKDDKYQDKEGKETDSLKMFREMVNEGVVPVLNGLHKDSAYAISVYDREREKIIFARNTKRPLAMAYLEDRSVMYWASEPIMLKFILNRAGLKHTMTILKEGVVVEFTPELLRNGSYDKAQKILHDFNPPKAEEVTPPPSVVINVTKEGKDKTNFPQVVVTKNNNVIPIGMSRKSSPQSTKVVGEKQSLKSFYTQCFCGESQMNLLNSYRMKRGEAGFPVYDPTKGKFWEKCCLENSDKIKGEVVNA